MINYYENFCRKNTKRSTKTHYIVIKTTYRIINTTSNGLQCQYIERKMGYAEAKVENTGSGIEYTREKIEYLLNATFETSIHISNKRLPLVIYISESGSKSMQIILAFNQFYTLHTAWNDSRSFWTVLFPGLGDI